MKTHFGGRKAFGWCTIRGGEIRKSKSETNSNVEEENLKQEAVGGGLEHRAALEPFPYLEDNSAMQNNEANLPPPESEVDARIVAECLAAGKQVPAEVVRRVRERAEQARRQLLASHGVQDIGVQIIREIRGELPPP
jgi:hypothetical protein